MSKFWLLTLLLSFFVANPSYAHRVKMFAWVNGSAINGEVYFGGGIKAQNAKVEIFVGDKLLASTKTNTKGEFNFNQLSAKNYHLTANAGPGHFAKFDVGAKEFTTLAPQVNDPAKQSQSATQAVTNHSSHSTTKNSTVNVSAASSQCNASINAAAVQAAIIPLRKQLDEFEAEVRLHDILGGLGYIFGLFGLWTIMRQRRV